MPKRSKQRNCESAAKRKSSKINSKTNQNTLTPQRNQPSSKVSSLRRSTRIKNKYRTHTAQSYPDHDLPSSLTIPTKKKYSNHSFDGITINAPELEGKYKLIGKIDHGGYATVYKAVDLSSNNNNNNIVAVKRVQSANIETLHQNHPCIEAKILEEFSSNIHFATLREILCDCSSGSYSIIMDYFEHDPFSQYNTILNEEDSIGYIYALLSCVHCLSLKGYIHRDVKPNNFLYCHKDKKCLLIDFGLCQSKKCVTNTHKKQGKARRSQSRYLRDGTPGFRAPEVILASNNQDSRIDVFSVGLILGSIMLGCNVIFNPSNDSQQLLQFINVYGLHTVYETANALDRKLEIRGLNRERIYMNNGANCLNSGSYVTGYELPDQQRDKFKLSYWIKQRLKLKENVNITTKREWSEDLYDLLDELTQFNPFKRVTPYQALQHKLFSAFQPVGKLN